MGYRQGVWRYIKNYKFNSIFIKNFILILLLTELPLAAVSVAIHYMYGNFLCDEVKKAHSDTVQRIKNTAEMVIIEAGRLLMRAATDYQLENFLKDTQGRQLIYSDKIKLADICARIASITQYTEYIESFYIYLDDHNTLWSSDYDTGELWKVSDNKWYDEYKSHNGLEKSWSISRETVAKGEKVRYITLFQKLPLYGEKGKGAIIVNINVGKLSRLLESVGKGINSSRLYIVDKKGYVLFDSNNKDDGRNSSDIQELNIIEESRSGSMDTGRGGTSSVVSWNVSDYNGWKYIYIVPFSEYYSKSLILTRILIVLIFISVFTTLLLSWFISVRVFSPIKTLTDFLETNGQAGGADKAGDEVKYIMATISNERSQMKHELDLRLALLKSVSMRALQSQINPHFLYNTLETINWTAMKLNGRDNPVSQMVLALSQLLRISLEPPENIISVSVETEHARLYVDLMMKRYKNFTVEWKIDEALQNCKTVKLSLQPLIENAIYHGIKQKKSGGTITVSGMLDGGDIVFAVSDNGAGITPERLQEVNKSLCNAFVKQDRHIGISNVNQRIKMLFGESYGLELKMNEKGGVTAVMRIPAVE